jgi:CBS domain-containing protein
MRIEQLMTKCPKSCRADSSLSDAARLMWENDVGCLPVTEGDGSGRLVGMITDRDICMAAYTAERALGEIRVAEAMTRDACACNPAEHPAEAGVIMREMGVRRLPVVDESERVIGLLSLADLAHEAVRQWGVMNCDITVGEVGFVLAAVCRPRQDASLEQAAALAQGRTSIPERQPEAT